MGLSAQCLLTWLQRSRQREKGAHQSVELVRRSGLLRPRKTVFGQLPHVFLRTFFIGIHGRARVGKIIRPQVALAPQCGVVIEV